MNIINLNQDYFELLLLYEVLYITSALCVWRIYFEQYLRSKKLPLSREFSFEIICVWHFFVKEKELHSQSIIDHCHSITLCEYFMFYEEKWKHCVQTQLRKSNLNPEMSLRYVLFTLFLCWWDCIISLYQINSFVHVSAHWSQYFVEFWKFGNKFRIVSENNCLLSLRR